MEPTPFLEFHAKKLLHTAQGKQWLDIRFSLEKGQTLAIYGPSGAGKTTLLRILAGLTEVHSGHIRLGDQTWLDTARGKCRPTRHRAIGFVFQDFALFPNLTVRRQLEYALPRPAKATSATTTSPAAAAPPPSIDELLSLMELEALQHHRPALLSGGQQQRVALARAIARRPSLLLLDEPLSALDDEMRNKLQEYIGKIQQRYHLTTILVSHHLPEILRLADTAITLKHGRIEKQGPPATLFAANAPAVPSSSAQPISLPATILAIQPAGEHHVLTVRCAESSLDIPIAPEQASHLAIGQITTITFNATNPTIVSE
ncbi:MAG TPA: ATP-binding cassette domain-containing protein [Puia sp.]|uniref:ATP-binding cassette domain-containing protein n=1 Tax=Puia sp. TaxID=2045100 RepID=UPI002CF7CAA4|nr:ATP-binding cassette domain-containing protein [Puia sp.]HVU95795.1 ATP-binding cassette domain-containing protein [Puia sp.]